MATYVITCPDPAPGVGAPSPRTVMIRFAEILGEDVRSHCVYEARDPYTGDEVSAHHRLGIVVRRTP